MKAGLGSLLAVVAAIGLGGGPAAGCEVAVAAVVPVAATAVVSPLAVVASPVPHAAVSSVLVAPPLLASAVVVQPQVVRVRVVEVPRARRGLEVRFSGPQREAVLRIGR